MPADPFYGGLTDGTVGLWSGGAGSLELVAQQRKSGIEHARWGRFSFAVLRDFFPDLPALNNVADTAFRLNLTGSGIDNTNDWACGRRFWQPRVGRPSGGPAPVRPPV